MDARYNIIMRPHPNQLFTITFAAYNADEEAIYKRLATEIVDKLDSEWNAHLERETTIKESMQ